MKPAYKIAPIVIFFSASLFLLSGCATTSPGKLSTPSGRPEVTIPNTNIQTVMDDVAAWLAGQGRTITGSSMYTISASFKKRGSNNGIFYSMLEHEAMYTIVQTETNVELYEKIFNVSNGSDELTSQSDYEDMQKELTEIAEFIKTRSSTEVTK